MPSDPGDPKKPMSEEEFRAELKRIGDETLEAILRRNRRQRLRELETLFEEWDREDKEDAALD